MAVYLLIAFNSVATLASAQSLDSKPTSNAVKRARSVRIPNGAIDVDGRLSEAEWQLAPPATDFIQQQPDEGAPSTHQTEVRFVYDDEYLYVGGRLHEDEPHKLLTNELRRDFSARDGDLFIVALDTFADRLNMYGFQTNPSCALREIQTYDDARTINENWDAVWFCRSSVEGTVWLVEMAIPFKQLRFPRIDAQLWGLQIFRLIRHANEPTTWNPVPRQFNQFRASYGGLLEGIAGINPGRNLRIKPFALGHTAKLEDRIDGSSDAGFDIKVGLGTNLVLDTTYRTDFSNVEADAQQINLTRFSLFFPEKREFFLENQGAFQVGPPASSSSNLIPFFSRTIGLSENGTPVPIVGGARLTGKIGRNAVGVLNMQTEEEPVGSASLPASNFTVLRYSRELFSNSMVGALVMNKSQGGVSNQVAGADMRLYPTRAWSIDALVMGSQKTDVGSGNAWRTGVQYDAGLDSFRVNYTSLEDSFRNDLGFIPRRGVDIVSGGYVRRWRPKATYQWVREYRTELEVLRYHTLSDGVQSARFSPKVTGELSDSSLVIVSVSRDEENLTAPFRPQGIPAGRTIGAGRHVFDSANISYTRASNHAFAPTAAYRFGEFYNGHRRGFTAGGRIRFNSKLATTLSISRDAIDLPNTSFDTTLVSGRIDLSFSTRMFLNAFIQYNSVTRQVLSNIRFDFIHHPLSDLFITYNDTRDVDGVRAPSQQLTIKLTHLFSF